MQLFQNIGGQKERNIRGEMKRGRADRVYCLYDILTDHLE